MTVRKRRRSGRSLSRIPVFPVTFPFHAGGQALLVTAVLATVALAFVHHAVLVVAAGVGQVLAYGAFEETFATFAAVHPIMLPCEETKGGGGSVVGPPTWPHTSPRWVGGRRGDFCPRVAGWGQDGGGVVLWGPPQEGPWCPHPLWPTPTEDPGVPISHPEKDQGVPVRCPTLERTLVFPHPTLRKIKVSPSRVPPERGPWCPHVPYPTLRRIEVFPCPTPGRTLVFLSSISRPREGRHVPIPHSEHD